MKPQPFFIYLLFLLVTVSNTNAVNITMYEQVGCHFCGITESTLVEMMDEYNISLTTKEIRYNATNLKEVMGLWDHYGIPMDERGTPTLLINGKLMMIGAAPKEKWVMIIENCDEGRCPEGAFKSNEITEDIFIDTNSSNDPSNGGNGNNTEKTITYGVLITAAVADSINPCTIAVMAMLLTAIFIQHNRRKVILAGTAFTVTIFVCYLLMGLGILKAIESTGLQTGFLGVMTILAFVMSALEIRAYHHYAPGGLALEMPIFLRPHVKRVLSKATTVPVVILAAFLCSMFLLPCSSGPYLVVLSMLSKAKTIENILYLLVYNLIFVLPFIAITIVVGLGFSTPEEVKEARDKYVKKMHLVSGLLMLIVAILVAYQFVKHLGII